MNLIARGILALLVGLFFLGCASVKDTRQFYIPNTAKTYPPRAKDAPIPILGQPPKEPYEVLGHLAFSTYQNFGFLRKSMEYNARESGADAVVLKQVNSQPQITPYYIPPTMNYVPVANTYVTSGKHGQTVVGYTTFIPTYQPGYWGISQSVLTTIDAEIILMKNPHR
ncbi:MAG: hypothetical protein ABI443_08245 [Chthoniobacterales bacterium]